MHPPQADDTIRIFDTTLRDGEQSPGASLTSGEKLMLAHQLAGLGVDVLEAGFPAASPDDHAAVRRVAHEVGGGLATPIIAGLARACPPDIESAAGAVASADRARIHTFLATSDLHLEHKLGLSRSEVIDRVGTMVRLARRHVDDVEFSPEDAGRSDPAFLIDVLAVAIEAGATTLNIPDTVGYTLPDEYGALIGRLIAETPGSDRVVWSVHCHDDLGLATANSLAGLRAGARQAEVTVNGIGERAGNASLEELVMAIATRGDELGLRTRVDPSRLCPTSRSVAELTGMAVPPNKAIVGANAFAHEAGIHQDGMLKHAGTYEIITPDTVGADGSRLVLGKHSGRHAFRQRLDALNVQLHDDDLAAAFRRFKRLAERKKTIGDADLLALVREEVSAPPQRWRFRDLSLAYDGSGQVTARVRVDEVGQRRIGVGRAEGAIDAVFSALGALTGIDATLDDFALRGVTPGADALGGVSVTLRAARAPEQPAPGFATDTDIVKGGARALVAAFNRLHALLPASAPPADPRQAAFADATATDPKRDNDATTACGRPIGRVYAEGADDGFPADYTVGIP